MPFLGLFRDRPQAAPARRLYRAVVRQARAPVFYRVFGVPDTVDGRFDMIALHGGLVLRRLKRDRPRTEALAQALFDHMFDDMDGNLREMGADDLGVGRRVRTMAELFYGRLAAYEAGLEGGDLAEALRRNLYRKADPDAGQIRTLAAYVVRLAAVLDSQPVERLLAGEIELALPPADDALANQGTES